jgi:hypothetical protein
VTGQKLEAGEVVRHTLVDQMQKTVVCLLYLASSEKGPSDELKETQTQTIDEAGLEASAKLQPLDLAHLLPEDRTSAVVPEKK